MGKVRRQIQVFEVPFDSADAYIGKALGESGLAVADVLRKVDPAEDQPAHGKVWLLVHANGTLQQHGAAVQEPAPAPEPEPEPEPAPDAEPAE